MEFMQPVHAFLGCATPEAWLDAAVDNLPLLLQDHANCEKKAAGTAMNLMFRYNDKPELQLTLAQLAREELLHYEQVMGLMARRGIGWQAVKASRYAEGLRQHARNGEPGRLVDILIIGAFVEARSCERFAALAPRLDDELRRFYTFLLRSECRHFEYYLAFARQFSPEPVDDRLALFRAVESDLIMRPDTVMRFHSGPPQVANAA